MPTNYKHTIVDQQSEGLTMIIRGFNNSPIPNPNPNPDPNPISDPNPKSYIGLFHSALLALI